MNKHIKILMFLTTMMYFFTSTVAPVLASVSYSYDANGNMTGNGTYCYEYNEANQVKRVRNCNTNQIIAEYVYDYDGNRLVKKNYTNGSLQKTVYSPSDDFETVKLASNGATQNTSYYYANGQLIAKKDPWGNKLYYQNDHLGSASTMTNQSGALVESTTYDPWGEVKIGGTQSKFQYTGQEKDSETGLNYYNARYYDPHIRRFTQPDSVIPNVYNPQDLNRYSYVRNNPLRYTDPTGHCIGPLLAICLAGIIFAPVIIANINPIIALTTQYFNDIKQKPTPANIILKTIDVVSNFAPETKAGGTVVKIGEKVIPKAEEIKNIAKALSSAGSKTLEEQGKEIENAASKWYKSTFNSSEDSLQYHLSKHGNGSTAEQYTNDALNLFQGKNDIMEKTILKDGTEGVKIKFGSQGGYFTPDGKIVTYWY